ncbi:MAG: DNA-directed RNA polymerase subunit omega [Planctomycetia bacterium]|nr:DNA-directed RNA polymerase subunit omega [Planctomycetia bacterium]
MIDELRDEKLIEKVGGRFKLSTLVQKRLVYLNKGVHSFVETDKKDKLLVVIQEIMEDKIYLDEAGNVCAKDEAGNDLGPVEFTYNSL